MSSAAVAPVAFEAVQRTTLVGRAVESLLDAIRSGTFGPGAKLPNEHALAAQLGVSRTAAREALQRLVSLDVLTARHGHGYFVEQMDAARAVRPEVLALSRGPEELLAILEARVALEKELAVLAARRATEADVARLSAALAELRAAVAEGQPGTEADVAFHLAIADAAGNRFLYRLTDVIRVYLERMRRSLPTWTHDRSDMLVRHASILTAVAAHDEAAAAVAMQSHMDMVLAQFEARRERVAE
ncbi:MAG TPA: FCD domain-containing protein, partial [Chloroflexota bacterium]|nr:FCD domain-containing protein [Chloroflexota bacterium]